VTDFGRVITEAQNPEEIVDEIVESISNDNN
jgi:orotidine-5'-phosphate decarboxylase